MTVREFLLNLPANQRIQYYVYATWTWRQLLEKVNMALAYVYSHEGIPRSWLLKKEVFTHLHWDPIVLKTKHPIAYNAGVKFYCWKIVWPIRDAKKCTSPLIWQILQHCESECNECASCCQPCIQSEPLPVVNATQWKLVPWSYQILSDLYCSSDYGTYWNYIARKPPIECWCDSIYWDDCSQWIRVEYYAYFNRITCYDDCMPLPDHSPYMLAAYYYVTALIDDQRADRYIQLAKDTLQHAKLTEFWTMPDKFNLSLWN